MARLSYAIATGRGEFPLDMLRYDSCWPRYEVGTCHMNVEGYREIQVTTYVKDGRRNPSIQDFTPARWKSFGWNLVEAP